MMYGNDAITGSSLWRFRMDLYDPLVGFDYRRNCRARQVAYGPIPRMFALS